MVCNTAVMLQPALDRNKSIRIYLHIQPSNIINNSAHPHILCKTVITVFYILKIMYDISNLNKYKQFQNIVLKLFYLLTHLPYYKTGTE